MGKRRDFVAEAMPQMKYRAKSRKAEIGSRHRLGWIMERSERCNMRWQMGDQWND